MTIGMSSPAAWLAEDDTEPWTYWFGPAATPLLTLNSTTPDDLGCLWECDEPEGWAATEAVTPLDERAFGDGAYAGDTTFTARTLTWDGMTTCPTRRAVQAAQRRLRAIAQSRTPVLYTQTDYPPQSLWVRASGLPKFLTLGGGLAFTWSFIMVAEDPYKFDASEATSRAAIMLPQVPPGRIYNRVYNYVYGAQPAGMDGTVVITNSGDETAPAVYTITGPAVRPVIVNTTTGQSFGIEATLTATDQLVIDTASGLVTFNGTPYYGLLTPGSAFPVIVPGANTIRWSADGTPNTTALLTVSSASTWK